MALVGGLVALAAAGAVDVQAAQGLAVFTESDGLRAVQMVVTAHPDDMMNGLVTLADDPSTYTVFITITAGERTGFCADPAAHLQEQWGEARPTQIVDPQVAGGECRYAPGASGNAFLTKAAEVVPAARKAGARGFWLDAPERDRWDPAVNHNYRADGVFRPDEAGWARDQVWLRSGDHSARVLIDAGDGDLTLDEVRWAISTVAAQRGTLLPDLLIDQIIAAAYWNDSRQHGDFRAGHGCNANHPCPGDPRAFENEHPDNHAVVLRVTAEAHRATRGALIATSAYDPDADETYSWTAEQYQALMGLGPRLSEAPDSFERVGAMQVTMGWMAYPRSYWATGEEALSSNDVVFPRVQHFRRVPPTYRAVS